MIKHPFNKSWYDKYDNVAKDTLVTYLKGVGHDVGEVKEDYNVDVVSTKKDFTYFNEAEVKRAWKGDWPNHWAEIRIPERKKKLLSKHKGNLKFYVFRNDMKQVWCIDSTQLTDDKLKEARGRNIMKGEQFYHVPYVEAQLIKVNELEVA